MSVLAAEPALNRQVVEEGWTARSARATARSAPPTLTNCRPSGAGRPVVAPARPRVSQDGVHRTAPLTDRLADGAVGDPAGEGVEAERQRRSSRQRLPPPLVGQLDGVRHACVGQRVGRGVRHRARHVRHAVERRVVHLVGRVGVRGRVGVLEAAALVDGDVDQHRARLHLRDQLVGDQLGRLRTRDQHRADDHVGLADLLLDRQLGGRQPVHPVVVAPRTTMRSLSRSVSSRVTSAPMPSAMFAAFWPETPAPMITTLAFATPPTPPSSTPRPPWALSSE